MSMGGDVDGYCCWCCRRKVDLEGWPGRKREGRRVQAFCSVHTFRGRDFLIHSEPQSDCNINFPALPPHVPAQINQTLISITRHIISFLALTDQRRTTREKERRRRRRRKRGRKKVLLPLAHGKYNYINIIIRPLVNPAFWLQVHNKRIRPLG